LDVRDLRDVFGDQNRARNSCKSRAFRREPVLCSVNGYEREVALIVALNLPPRRISLPHDADGCAHHGTSLRISHISRESRRRERNPRRQPAEQRQDSVE
jgi:hypothetical protein